MIDPVQELTDSRPTKDHLIGFDSDGFVFDSTEIRQKECIGPAFIDNFTLQPVAGAAREVLEFVNRYSKTRGVNRYPGSIRVTELPADGVLFVPIVPGGEEESWLKLRKEGLNRFFDGTFAGVFRDGLLAEFDAALPEKAPRQN